MPRPHAFTISYGQYQIGYQNLRQRINRRLAQLIPYRQLEYRSEDRQYYIVVTDLNNKPDIFTNELNTHRSSLGPYYIHHWIALADHIDMWDPQERIYDKVVNQKGFVAANIPLPKELQFDVVSHVLVDAVAALRLPPAPMGSTRYNEECKAAVEQAYADGRLTRPAPVTAAVTPYVPRPEDEEDFSGEYQEYHEPPMYEGDKVQPPQEEEAEPTDEELREMMGDAAYEQEYGKPGN